MALLLVLGAKLEKRGADHRRAHAGERGTCTDAPHLLEQYQELSQAQARTAVRRGPHRHRVPALGAALEPDQ